MSPRYRLRKKWVLFRQPSEGRPRVAGRSVLPQEFSTLSPGDLLNLIVEASLALAGFAGVVNALAQRGAGALPAMRHLNLVNLLATSFGALFLSLAGLGMMVAGLEEPLTWRILSAVGLLITAYFMIRSANAVVAAVRDRGAGGLRVLLTINVSLLFVCVIQVWNATFLGSFWPVFALLVALFAVGCFSFTRLLFARAA